jgi:hypothetical protein
MKRKITVEIDIDTDRDGETRLHGKTPNDFTIDIRSDIADAFGNKPGIVPCTLAHELGHLIGHVFNLPAAANEPRSLFHETTHTLTESFGQRILASENEAWDIAELLLLESQLRRIAIRGYEEGFGVNNTTENYFKNNS